MISSNSNWDREFRKKVFSPAFSLGHGRVTYEFTNRRSQKIFPHKLGRVEFRDNLQTDLDQSRNSLIQESIGQKDIEGYVYKTVSHTYTLPTLLGPDLLILAHGSPRSGGYENCSLIGAECEEGENSKCEPGKCRVGKLTRVKDDKWRYDSINVPGLYYFVFGTEVVRLRSITRGKFTLPAGSGEVDIPFIASPGGSVYLPPSTYSVETFTRRAVKSLDSVGLRSVKDSVDDFTRALLDGYQKTVGVQEEVKDKLLSNLKSTVSDQWYSYIEQAVNSVWLKRFEGAGFTNRDFSIECYKSLSSIYSSGLYVSLSGIRSSRINIDGSISRPIYNRLPGISGSYNDESRDTPAKWLTSGADNELSGSKTLIDTFYRVFLDPQTCYPLNLDWIAQHMGFMGSLWNLEWPSSVKRKLLENAHVNRAEGLPWTTDSSLDTLRRIDFSKIERVSVDGNLVTLKYRYSSKKFNSETGLVEIDTGNDLVVDMTGWQGILPSRGSLRTLLFMLWILGIKAPSPEEMQFDQNDNTYIVRSGLRENEANSPVNVPYIVDVLKVGDEKDAETLNYPNQLIADVSTCQDELSANTTVLRMPFYYNRNGKSWDAAKSIMENYCPSTSINRVQYAYEAADLLVAEDIFFEPVVDNA